MLRLALARSSPRCISAATRWRRLNSNKSDDIVGCLPKQDILPHEAGLPSTITEKEYASTVIHGRSLHLPFFHPRTHDIPVANIHFRSHHIRLLDLFTHFATHAASALGIPTSKVVYLPTQRSLWTVPRSPFVHKKSQENFERRVHKRAIKAWDADPEVVDKWFKYLRRHALGGVGMKMIRWERMPLGIGETSLKDVEMQLESHRLQDAEKIKALGQQIVVEELSSSRQDSVAPHQQ